MHACTHTHTDEMRVAHTPKIHEASAFLISPSNDTLAGLEKPPSACSAIPTHSLNRDRKKKEVPFWTRHYINITKSLHVALEKAARMLANTTSGVWEASMAEWIPRLL